jgi:hypothetical protein
MDKTFKRHSHYTSYTKTFNNKPTEISKAISDNKVTYIFSFIDDHKTYKLNGIIECKLKDEDKATRLLEEIIKSVIVKQ